MVKNASVKRIAISGVWVDPVTEEEAVDRVRSFVEGGECLQILTANPLMILAAEKDNDLNEAFRSAELVVADSVGVQWAARLQGRRLEKISGIDLMESLCVEAAGRGWRVYFLGAAPGVAEDTARVLTARYPGLHVVGTHHGYFKGKDNSRPCEEDIIHRIAEAKPDLLFVALSTPFQDGWIHKNRARLKAKVAMGVGGSFDVISGRLRRAPAWMRAAGLEWLFRLLQEPQRASRMLGLPVFLTRTLLSHPWKNP
jgi:N-acetylglucosaminyldiphosphoundecaprenol N-acetyl-beta-D-mannosaminyltransferase